ncbi:MAG: Ig-like domain-containing protein [Dehalococcoidia bacterium]
MISRLLVRTAIASILSLLLVPAIAGCSEQQREAPPVQQPVAVTTTDPVITALSADRQVPLLGKTSVICTVSDPNGDNLTYDWTATGGVIDGTTSTVTWTAPDKGGDFDITVVVSNIRGGSATGNIIINVPEKPNNPPVIAAVKFTRQGRLPITIKLSGVQQNKIPDLVIKKFETADISCLASDPDNDKLDYTWMTTGGKLIGNGATVQWIAAGEPGDYTISVEVSDGKGGTVTFKIPVTVKCCGV